MNKKEIHEYLNSQLNMEHFAFYQYLAMAAFLAAKGMNGFSNWCRVQSREELRHGDRIFNYLTECGIPVKLPQIDEPKQSWSSIVDVFKSAKSQEVEVTNHINKIVSLAKEDKNHAVDNFLQWFVSEQVEEEAALDGIIQKLEFIGEDKSALLVMDNELSEREAKLSLD